MFQLSIISKNDLLNISTKFNCLSEPTLDEKDLNSISTPNRLHRLKKKKKHASLKNQYIPWSTQNLNLKFIIRKSAFIKIV